MSRRAGRSSSDLTRLVLRTYGASCWLKLPGCTRIATTKDHLVPYAHGGTDDVSNFRPACQPCNAKRQDKVISGVGATIRIVTGPPAAGKSTYVLERAERGHIIIDLDVIAHALMAPGTAADQHTYPEYVRHIAIGARRAAIDRATRLSYRTVVWIIHAIPEPDELAMYRSLHYEVVEVDPGRDVVTARCATRPPYTLAAVDRWYATKLGTTRPVDSAYDSTTKALEHAGITPSRDW